MYLTSFLEHLTFKKDKGFADMKQDEYEEQQRKLKNGR